MSGVIKLNMAEVETKRVNMAQIEAELRKLAVEVKKVPLHGTGYNSQGKMSFRVAQMTGTQAITITKMADTVAAMSKLVQDCADRLDNADKLLADTYATVELPRR